MKKRSLLLFTTSLISSFILLNKKHNSNQGSSKNSDLFIGNWNYIDQKNIQHQLVIDKQLNLFIDDQLTNQNAPKVMPYTLYYIDHFGYQLIIKANEVRPITYYDEASNLTFNLLASK
ncbi:DUF4828 domain-containing protein [Lentilactobacillus laojiaonis]|uniref:DUF4828 domain-containing protein n=1 Tax=Lentilactobacillus laojiaonis TaxID=2883998 RepID=UPI001D0B57F8|nr:DUF4828 domain-containing protein [Lentilactobacillus laojiaonis]UDM32422.1 DUF4828 domain-containing protein [Lentilactobacillus laojiaonis]